MKSYGKILVESILTAVLHSGNLKNCGGNPMADDSKKTVFRKIVVPEEQKKKYLVGNSPPFLGKPFELGSDGLTIGREEGRSIQLPSDMVSRLHATICQKESGYCIVDNESSNGTFINAIKLPPMQPTVLNHRDVIKFDNFEFIFVDTACADLWQTLKPLSGEGSQIITLYSPKGGTGLTSVAINLAACFAASGKKVAIADLDLRFGDVQTYCVGKPGYSIHELIQETDITGENIEKFLHAGPGFRYLPIPPKLEYAELVKGEHVKKILWSLQSTYDFVIVDCKNEVDDVSITSWELSNLILLLGHPEIGHILALRKVLDVMSQFKYPESKVRLLLNRMGREGTLNSDEIKSLLKRDFISLPDAPADAIVTTHAGQIYVNECPNSPLSVGVKNIEREIRGEVVEAAAAGGIFSRLRSALGF